MVSALMKRRSTFLAAALASLAAAAPAAAQTAQPAPATLTIATQNVGADGAVLARSSFGVTGKLDPAPAGEKVTIRLYRGTKKVRAKTAAVAPDGTFAVTFRERRHAALTVRASHRATPALGSAVAKPTRVLVLPRSVSRGARGVAVRLLQNRLARLGYVVGRRGTYDARTARAVLAMRKVTGMSRTSSAGRAVMSRLARGGGRFRVRFPKHGKHIEADLSRQVIALVRGGRVERIYPTSSGSPATPTIRGHFRFYLAQPGYNSKEMYYSKYFKGEYAIHGYKSVPVYPASHGCLRVPNPDAKSIFDWIAMGDRIDVYR